MTAVERQLVQRPPARLRRRPVPRTQAAVRAAAPASHGYVAIPLYTRYCAATPIYDTAHDPSTMIRALTSAMWIERGLEAGAVLLALMGLQRFLRRKG